VLSKLEGRVAFVSAASRPVWIGPRGIIGQFN